MSTRINGNPKSVTGERWSEIPGPRWADRTESLPSNHLRVFESVKTMAGGNWNHHFVVQIREIKRRCV